MPVPLLKQGPFVVAVLRAALTDHDWERLRQKLMEQSGAWRSQGVVVDLTQMDVIDSFAARTVRDLAAVLRLRGLETVLVGIQPDVAFAMVQLGLRLEGVPLALDLEEGLALLKARVGARRHHG